MLVFLFSEPPLRRPLGQLRSSLSSRLKVNWGCRFFPVQDPVLFSFVIFNDFEGFFRKATHDGFATSGRLLCPLYCGWSGKSLTECSLIYFLKLLFYLYFYNTCHTKFNDVLIHTRKSKISTCGYLLSSINQMNVWQWILKYMPIHDSFEFLQK